MFVTQSDFIDPNGRFNLAEGMGKFMSGVNGYSLAGDIGGTKTLLGIFSEDRGKITFREKKRYVSKDFSGLEDIVRAFLREVDVAVNRRYACFGIAGPCTAGVCRTRNLPWVVDADGISRASGVDNVILINDFEANVHAISQLSAGELEVLNRGSRDPEGNVAVIGAGTGLGEAFAVYDARFQGLRVFPSEGGHADFGPKNNDEAALWGWLKKKYGHVSCERILSGEGLVNIYGYLASTGRYDIPASLKKAFSDSSDPAATISKFGLKGTPQICAKALHMFVAIYGSEAGNLALKILPYGGLYIAGGIS
ncbi:MAG: glucokinase, partial [bacterium]|nr:glucokinase [bacterium]